MWVTELERGGTRDIEKTFLWWWVQVQPTCMGRPEQCITICCFMWSWFHISHLLVGCPVNIIQHCQIKQSNRAAVLNSCADMRGATGRKRKQAKEACELHKDVLVVLHRQDFWKLVWFFEKKKKIWMSRNCSDRIKCQQVIHFSHPRPCKIGPELRYWRTIDFIIHQSFVSIISWKISTCGNF